MNGSRLAIFGGLAGMLLAQLLACGSTSRSPEATHIPEFDVVEGAFLDGFFPIGVFSQPLESFGKWKERGVNTLLEVPMNHDPVAWDRAAQQAGMRIIRRPLGDGRSDIGRKDLLAWSHYDEPDAAGRIFTWTPAFEKTFAEWRRIDPNRKVFLNLAGPDVSWFLTRDDSYSKNYASYYPRLLAVTDWVANDLYPSGGYLNNAHASRRGDIALIAEPIKILKRLTDKPQFAFIELSEIEAGNVAGARCPTAEEVRAEIWYAIVHGVRGLFYFPAVVGKRGFQFDGAPPALVEEIKRQNALITRLAPVLQTAINPSESAATISVPLEVGWRKAPKSYLYIVVNPSRSKIAGAELKLTGVGSAQAEVLGESRSIEVKAGVIRDDFAPLAVHIYEVRKD